MVKFAKGCLKAGNNNLNVQAFTASNTIKSLAAANNSSSYIIDDKCPVLNQGNLSSCTSFSATMTLSILLSLENGGNFVALSQLFLYFNSRVPLKMTNQDSGTYLHLAYQSIQSIGVCEDKLMPYMPGQVFAQPSMECYREANSNTISDFFEIKSFGQDRINEIELSIRANHCVSFATDVNSDFENYAGDNTVFGELSGDGHALLIVGCRDGASGKEFKIKNSWGSSWGQNGHCWVRSDFLTSQNTSDIFVPTKMNNLMV